jgi:hypothetical protein
VINNEAEPISFVYLRVSTNQNNEAGPAPNDIPPNEEHTPPAHTSAPSLENKSATPTAPLSLQTEPPMEVHHHSHTARKKWNHYLWEFIMLFLAVFAGFLAENQREHFIEHQREKSFMNSMIKDLEADTATFRLMTQTYTEVTQHADSLVELLSHLSTLEKNAQTIYNHQIYLHNYFKLIYSDRTIQQLKNGGNFRLIRNKQVSDNIIFYDGLVRNMIDDMQEKLILTRHLNVNDGEATIFKFAPMGDWLQFRDPAKQAVLPNPPYFISPTQEKVDHFINNLVLYSFSLKWFIENIRRTGIKANALNDLIRKEYKIK